MAPNWTLNVIGLLGGAAVTGMLALPGRSVFLQKPCAAADLADRVRRMLDVTVPA